MITQRLIIFLTAILLVGAGLCNGGSNDLVAVTSANARIRLDIRYATTNNFTGEQVYPCAKAYLHKPTAMKLAKAQEKLEIKGIALKVYDDDRMRVCAVCDRVVAF